MIEVSKILAVSEVNGPGARSVIWVQGCRKRCPGCWNPNFLEFREALPMTPEALVREVSTITNSFRDIEGVTFSGGEPFEQAEDLAQAALLFKKSGLGIMSYSGYTLEEIRTSGAGKKILLDQLDLLVDGEYKRELACNQLWRSSTNQTVHFLTRRYTAFQSQIDNGEREFEITIDTSGIMVTGFPTAGFLGGLTK